MIAKLFTNTVLTVIIPPCTYAWGIFAYVIQFIIIEYVFTFYTLILSFVVKYLFRLFLCCASAIMIFQNQTYSVLPDSKSVFELPAQWVLIASFKFEICLTD